MLRHDGCVNASTVNVFPLSFRADVGSVHAEDRTVDIVFSTGAPVLRYDYMAGKRYWEILSMDPAHVRLQQINSIGVVLDTHSAYSVGDVLGAVKRDSARIEKGKGIATLQFSRRDSVAPVWQDVQDGILRSFSVGAKVFKAVEDVGKDGVTRRTAVDWEPFEISLVPMPADVGATTRSAEVYRTNPCVIERLQSDADRTRRLRFAQAF